MSKTYVQIGIIVLVMLLLGVAIGYFALRPDPTVIYKPYVETKRDTVQQVVEVPKEVIRIRQVATVRYVHDTLSTMDTIYSTTAFIASLDTIVKKDTLNISYSFPQNIFDVAYHPSPDSIITNSIDVIRYIPREKAWHEETWFRIATHVAAILTTVYICKR